MSSLSCKGFRNNENPKQLLFVQGLKLLSTCLKSHSNNGSNTRTVLQQSGVVLEAGRHNKATGQQIF